MERLDRLGSWGFKVLAAVRKWWQVWIKWNGSRVASSTCWPRGWNRV